MSTEDNDYLSDPELMDGESIEWLSDAVEFDYETFIIQYWDGVWTAWHNDEEVHPEPIVLQFPEEGIYFNEDTDLFGEHTLTVEEFQLLREHATNIS